MSIRFQIVTSDSEHGDRHIRHDIPAESYSDAELDAIREHGKRTGVSSISITAELVGILDENGHSFHGFHVREFFSHDGSKWMYQVMLDGELPGAEYDEYAYTGPNEPTAKGCANRGNAALAEARKR